MEDGEVEGGGGGEQERKKKGLSNAGKDGCGGGVVGGGCGSSSAWPAFSVTRWVQSELLHSYPWKLATSQHIHPPWSIFPAQSFQPAICTNSELPCTLPTYIVTHSMSCFCSTESPSSAP